jgi:5'-nucleotidase
MSPDKSLLIGNYLIDDQDNANQREFKGKWIHFGSNEFKSWDSVLNYFI